MSLAGTGVTDVVGNLLAGVCNGVERALLRGYSVLANSRVPQSKR